jgi:hypothetical protein
MGHRLGGGFSNLMPPSVRLLASNAKRTRCREAIDEHAPAQSPSRCIRPQRLALVRTPQPAHLQAGDRTYRTPSMSPLAGE